MSIRKTLGNIVLASVIGIAGCSKKPKEYIKGEVIKEYGSIIEIVDSNKVSGNKLAKFEIQTAGFWNPANKTFQGGGRSCGRSCPPMYGLKVKTSQNIYTMNVNDYAGSPGPQTEYTLAEIIKEGTKIKFPLKVEVFLPRGYSTREIFHSDSSENLSGSVDPDDIIVLSD